MNNIYNNKNIICILIFILGIGVRFYYSVLDSYWFDEQISFYISNPVLTLDEFFKRNYLLDKSPFFFNYLLKNWFAFFEYNPSIGRLFSVFNGVLSLIAFFYLSKKILKNNYLILLLFLSSFNIFLISYSAETRPYSLVVLLSLIQIIFFYELYFIKYKFFKQISFIFISLILLYTHPFTFILLLSEIFYVLIFTKKNKFFINFFLIFFIYLFSQYNYLLTLFNYNPPISFIDYPNAKFFIFLYFDKFFGSKIMGTIFLFIFIFLIYKNYNRILKNKFIIFLFIFLFFSYFLPLIYGYLFNPILQDKYIIFVLIPILFILVILISELQNKKLRIYIILILIVATIINQYFEIHNRNSQKPDFKNAIKQINKSDVKFISVISFDKIHAAMVDSSLTDKFKERDIMRNYLENHEMIKNEITFFNQDDLNKKIKKFWMICYIPVVGECEENIRINDEYKIVEKNYFHKVNLYLIDK